MNKSQTPIIHKQEEEFALFLNTFIHLLANEAKLNIDNILEFLHKQYPEFTFKLTLTTGKDKKLYSFPAALNGTQDKAYKALSATVEILEKHTCLALTILSPKSKLSLPSLNQTYLESITNIIAYWIRMDMDKAKLHEHEFNLKRHNLRMEILHEISLSLTQLGSTSEVAEQLLNLIPGILDVRACAVLLVNDKHKLAITGSVGVSAEEIAHIPDTELKKAEKALNPLIYHSKRFFETTGFKEVMLTPIKEKQVFYGLILLFDRESRQGIIPFSAEDISLMESISSITAVAIQNSHLFTEVLDGKAEKETLLNSAPVAIIATDTEGKITAINQTAFDRLGFTPEHIRRHIQWNSLIKGVQDQCPLYLRNANFKVPSGMIYGDINIVPLLAHSKKLKGSLIAIQDLSETNRIKEIFKRYVSDNIVSMLLEQPDKLVLGGVERHVTVLFSDIRRFTLISAKLTPKQTVTILNEYFAIMVNIILKHNGTLDKIVGDGIMAVFGAPLASPEDTDNAVLCALDMMKAMKKVHAILNNNALPIVDIGIGIDSGKVVSGNIGSPQQMNFTIIGNAANNASHICDKAKPAEILITPETFNLLKGKHQFQLITPILLKNESIPTKLYSRIFTNI